MKMSSLNTFVSMSILSRAGNACAEYAFIWYGIQILSKSHDKNDSGVLMFYYIGQALGMICLSPIISKIFDKLPKKTLISIGIDFIYMVLLMIAVFLFTKNLLTPTYVFLIVSLMAPLGIAHSHGVAMYAIKNIQKDVNKIKLGEKVALSLSVSYFIGVLLSGIIFSKFGFIGCMYVGVVTFIPIIVCYLAYFPKIEDGIYSNTKSDFSYVKVIREFKSNKILMYFILLVSILNITAAIMPALVGMNLEKNYPNRQDLFSITIGLGIVAGIFYTRYFQKIAHSKRVNLIMPEKYLVLVIMMIALYFINIYLVLFAMFAWNCIASASVNITSGALRLSLIKPEYLGRVNNFISMLQFSGQLIGGFFLIPLLKERSEVALLYSAIPLFLASILSIFLLPKERLSDVL